MVYAEARFPAFTAPMNVAILVFARLIRARGVFDDVVTLNAVLLAVEAANEAIAIVF